MMKDDETQYQRAMDSFNINLKLNEIQYDRTEKMKDYELRKTQILMTLPDDKTVSFGDGVVYKGLKSNNPEVITNTVFKGGLEYQQGIDKITGKVHWTTGGSEMDPTKYAQYIENAQNLGLGGVTNGSAGYGTVGTFGGQKCMITGEEGGNGSSGVWKYGCDMVLREVGDAGGLS